jgi:hypothetical protein
MKANNEVKAGDEVVVLRNGRSRSIKTVTKVTATGRIVIGSDTFNADGTQRGGKVYSRNRILFDENPADLRREREYLPAYGARVNETHRLTEEWLRRGSNGIDEATARRRIAAMEAFLAAMAE